MVGRCMPKHKRSTIGQDEWESLGQRHPAWQWHACCRVSFGSDDYRVRDK
jgi:hypothetical protein